VLANPFLLDMPVPALRALPADWINDVTAVGTTALDRVADVQNPLIHQVRAALEAGERPVVIGADCCTPIAVVAGLSRAGVSPRVLWLDAHGDFNTPTTSPSGFLGGMPLAMLVGRGDRRLLEAAGLAPLSERDVVLFDARDLDPDEAIALSGSEIRHVRSLAALQQALSDDGPWHVHLDVDVVNLEDAPSVGFPVEGGPRLADLLLIGRAMAARCPPVSVSLTTWDFEADRDGRTARASLQLLDAWLGRDGA
jgi:arginase